MEAQQPYADARAMNRVDSKRWMLLVLVLINGFTSVDFQALGLALQSIKVDLHLSDTQLGFLTGMAFALFYSVMGLPLARWADRGNRVTLIAMCTALYGGAVALCGAAGSFLQLMLIRIGVAVGEAGCFPATNSLLADSFVRAERPRAMAISLLGAPLSVMVGYFLVGWLNQEYGWRLTFALLGTPGLLLATITALTLKEPRASTANVGLSNTIGRPVPALARTPSRSAQPTIREVAITLWSKRTFRHLLFGFSALSFFGGGIAQWQPAFLIRSFGLNTGALGTWLTLIYGLGGFLGTWWSGQWASRRAANDEPRQLKAIALGCAVTGVASAMLYLSPNHYLAFAFMAITAVGFSITTAPLFATLQTLVPDRMRAVSVALIYLFSNLIGMGFGPLTVGTLSDLLRSFAGEESLRYALLAMTPGYLWAAWHLWRARHTVTADVAKAGSRLEYSSTDVSMTTDGMPGTRTT
jgi:MFS family permease